MGPHDCSKCSMKPESIICFDVEVNVQPGGACDVLSSSLGTGICHLENNEKIFSESAFNE